MHDKRLYPRRAVLVALVAVSLITLTAYFGGSPTSPLHSLQRGVVQALSPVQRGASAALAPVRDVAGWFSDTLRAGAQRNQLRHEVQSLQAKLALYQRAYEENGQLTRLVGLDTRLGVARYRPVAAQVIERDPTLWYQTVEIDRGSAAGVRVDDPVIGDGGLVGRISLVGSSFAMVALITDDSMAVAAQVQDAAGDSGVLVPDVGNPEQLLVQYLPRAAGVQVGQQVVTAGFRYGALESLYPPGIPIGTVTRASQGQLAASGQIQVAPTVDLRHLDVVQVLTAASGGAARAAGRTRG